ncbi:nucleotidyltransferase domain-containing protein [Amycolatopsis sp.]|uniref:nucleotidyltransferase domain-containing protein n=1 Tax=Amycolatopsis sp. TaxID=37632 RepID=UPI002DFC367A|nr:nucleotidyltransferase domain-containing protein [Amycolatopsis sp.]
MLAVLAMNDIVFTTGQLHRVLRHHSEEGIRKVLRRLTRQGIVLSDKVGQAFAYRFNREHLAAEQVIGLARLMETFLARLESHLESWETPPVYAAVFGSAVKGTMTADSDLDLLLVRPDDADGEGWRAQVGLLVADVTRWTGNDTRPLEFTAGEIAARGREERVLLDVLEEGLTVAGTHAWLTKQLRRSKD